MINKEEVLFYHRQLIRRFGGSDGVRSHELLESAIGRAYQTFGGQDLYASAVEKAAALGESIIKNHPLVDGNKRTGYAMMRLLILESGQDLNANEEDKYQFVIRISTGQLDYDAILDWLKTHLI